VILSLNKAKSGLVIHIARAGALDKLKQKKRLGCINALTWAQRARFAKSSHWTQTKIYLPGFNIRAVAKRKRPKFLQIQPSNLNQLIKQLKIEI